MTKAVLIGGGIVGLCTALRLAERQMDVTVVDNPPIMGASSWGNIGHIATEQCAPLASWPNILSIPRRLYSVGGPVGLPLSAISAWLPFGLRMMKAAREDKFEAGMQALTDLLHDALPAWKRLDALWPAQSILQSDGHFVIWESKKTAAAGRKAWAASPLGSARFRDASDTELNTLSKITPKSNLYAIRFENTGKITDLQTLRLNLIAKISALNGAFLNRTVQKLNIGSRRVEVILDNREIISPDLVVVCAGARSAELMEPLGHVVPLIAERGYHVETTTAEITSDSMPMVFEDRSVVINGFQHGLRIAGFVEFANLSTPPDQRKWQRLEQHLDQLAIQHTGTPRRWMGARPTLPDYLPAIGRSTKAGNLLYAFGHQHLGLTLAPLTAELITTLAFEEPMDDTLSSFSVDRFL